MQKRYGREVQTLYKTLAFGMVTNLHSGQINRGPLETIVSDAKTKAPLFSSLVSSVGPSSSSSSTNSHLLSMKIVAILVILICQYRDLFVIHNRGNGGRCLGMGRSAWRWYLSSASESFRPISKLPFCCSSLEGVRIDVCKGRIGCSGTA